MADCLWSRSAVTPAAVTALAYSEDGKVLASASARQFDQDLGHGDRAGDAHVGRRWSIADPRDGLFAHAIGAGNVGWRQCGQALGFRRRQANWAAWNLAGSEVLSAAFSPDGTALAVAGTDGKIVVRTLATGQVLADFVAPDHAIVHSIRKRRIAALVAVFCRALDADRRH